MNNFTIRTGAAEETACFDSAEHRTMTRSKSSRTTRGRRFRACFPTFYSRSSTASCCSGYSAMMGVKIYGNNMKEIKRIGFRWSSSCQHVPGAQRMSWPIAWSGDRIWNSRSIAIVAQIQHEHSRLRMCSSRSPSAATRSPNRWSTPISDPDSILRGSGGHCGVGEGAGARRDTSGNRSLRGDNSERFWARRRSRANADCWWGM